VSTDTLDVYARAGIGGRFTLGERPAVLVVDFSCAFADDSIPLGMDLSGPIERTREVADAARDAGVPVIFVTLAYHSSGADAGIWLQKLPGLGALTRGSDGIEIDPRLAPRDDELVVVKTGASAFFGTNLSAVLASQRIDTVVLCGATTSGCVRATAIDLLQYGYPTLVPRECVGDRAPGPHEANLVDIGAKYSDVVPVGEALAYIRSVGARRAAA
jgi:nicotinamidase-related amidase